MEHLIYWRFYPFCIILRSIQIDFPWTWRSHYFHVGRPHYFLVIYLEFLRLGTCEGMYYLGWSNCCVGYFHGCDWIMLILFLLLLEREYFLIHRIAYGPSLVILFLLVDYLSPDGVVDFVFIRKLVGFAGWSGWYLILYFVWLHRLFRFVCWVGIIADNRKYI